MGVDWGAYNIQCLLRLVADEWASHDWDLLTRFRLLVCARHALDAVWDGHDGELQWESSGGFKEEKSVERRKVDENNGIPFERPTELVNLELDMPRSTEVKRDDWLRRLSPPSAFWSPSLHFA